MQSWQKGNAILHAACAAEKAACAKSFLEMSLLQSEKAAQKKRIAELTGSLAEELSARKRSITDKMHKERDVDDKSKLIEQIEQLFVGVADLKGEVDKGKGAVVDLKVKLKVAEKRAVDFAYKKYGLQACLHLSQGGQDKMG